MSNITDRLFFAIRPDAAASERIMALRSQLCAEQGLTGPLQPAEQFLITLHHLGDFARFPQALVDKAMAAAASLDVPAFDIVLDRAVSLKRREPRHLPCVLQAGEPLGPLKALHQALIEALKAAELYRYAAFVPQLPLLHDNIPVESQPLGPVGWRVSELLLINTRLASGEQQQLASWPLT